MNDKPISDFSPKISWSQRREAKNISLQQVADSTNIPIKKLEALENGQFAELGNETFVMGYIRSYAKILKEDAHEYLEEFRGSSQREDDNNPQINPANLSSSRPGKTWKGVSVFHLSIAVIVLWWLLVMVLGDDHPSEETIAVEPDIISEADSSHSNMSGEELVEMGRTSLVTDPIEVIEAPISGLEAVKSSATQQIEAVSDELNPLVETQRPGIANEDILILSFSEDCWTEIRESNGRVLIAELKRKGDNLQLFGQAPFSVMLGNSRAVTLSLNGEVVSTVPPGNRKTLRMVVE